jgi:hypothetical protein
MFEPLDHLGESQEMMRKFGGWGCDTKRRMNEMLFDFQHSVGVLARSQWGMLSKGRLERSLANATGSRLLEIDDALRQRKSILFELLARGPAYRSK